MLQVIPIEKAIDPWGDAILAYEMNGETLPRDHGFPVRLLAPGTAGCRNPKWVRQIIVSAEASELDSGSRLDRHFAPDISFDEHKYVLVWLWLWLWLWLCVLDACVSAHTLPAGSTSTRPATSPRAACASTRGPSSRPSPYRALSASPPTAPRCPAHRTLCT